MKFYQLWGPLTALEKSFMGIWGNVIPAEFFSGRKPDFYPSRNHDQELRGLDLATQHRDLNTEFNPAVTRPTSTNSRPFSSGCENCTLNLTCFVDWASNSTDVKYEEYWTLADEDMMPLSYPCLK
ncbi:UNVERIFIED_CONTAM: hypothetical protein FKN15_044749 [Acipenser sinensis]